MIAPLYQAFQNSCLPPAWLFVGPPTADKSAAAYLLAQKILCDARGPEQSVIVQRQMELGYYPNFFVLKKKSSDAELGIDDVRQLINYLRTSAPLPGWRVVVIEGIDTLNRHAANALLKTLEEPPAQTLILATAITAARVLPTLRSRCVRLVFQANEVKENEDDQAHEDIGKAVAMAARGDFRSLLPVIEKLAQDDQSFTKATCLIEQFIYKLIICSVSFSNKDSWIATAPVGPRNDGEDSGMGEVPSSVIASKAKQSSVPNSLFTTILQDTSIEHWLNVQQALSQFLHEAQQTHLDKKHTLMACFIIIENPT
ncbi:MAG: AAA family ATPase [Alphaproteobacteria bacterium]